MTKDEIKKALKRCQDYDYESCVGCPYRKYSEDCTNDILKDALNLINEYEKEIEQLKSEIIKQDQEIIERNFELVELEDKVKQAKIDVLNKVKERAVGLAAIETYHICNLIDELIKEVEK